MYQVCGHYRVSRGFRGIYEQNTTKSGKFKIRMNSWKSSKISIVGKNEMISNIDIKIENTEFCYLEIIIAEDNCYTRNTEMYFN